MRLFALGDPEIGDARQLPSFRLLQQMADDGTKLWFYASEPQMRLLARALDSLPSLIVVLNHLGFCPGQLQLDENNRPRFATKLPPPSFPTTLQLAEYPNVHVLFSGHYAFSERGFPYQDLTPVVSRLLEAFGPSRLLFGSDFPWIRNVPGYSAVLSLVDLQLPDLSPEERRDVLDGNARRLFGFAAPAQSKQHPQDG
jgi:predicted TIM-barrel fold metal-dependent hydrolase